MTGTVELSLEALASKHHQLLVLLPGGIRGVALGTTDRIADPVRSIVLLRSMGDLLEPNDAVLQPVDMLSQARDGAVVRV